MLNGITEGFKSRIPELACIIASKTAEIDGFLAMKDLPLPSFHTEAPPDLHLSEDLEAARNLNLIPALEPGAQILNNDTCMSEPGTVPWRQESTIRTLYLAMLQIQNSRDREEHDWKRLLIQADEGYRLQRVIRPLGSVLAIILTVWDYEVM
ncbi:hypothetical protein BDR22DRAFT_886164 [Usnea florida]